MNSEQRIMRLILMMLMVAGVVCMGQHAAAQTGVYLKKTLTFTDSLTSKMTFSISGPKADAATTTVWLEFGSDDNARALSSTLTATSFQLAKSGSMSRLTLFNGMTNDRVWLADKKIQFNETAPRLFRIDITHFDVKIPPDGSAIPIGGSEAWDIYINNFPVGTNPSARLIVYISDPKGEFLNLTPTGPCVTSLPNMMVNVTVTPPSAGGNTVTFTATPINAPAGSTYTFNWYDESPSANSTDVKKTSTGTTSTYSADISDCTCCCNMTLYRVDVLQGGTVLASNRNAYLQKDLSCDESSGGIIDFCKGHKCEKIDLVPEWIYAIEWPPHFPPDPKTCPKCQPEWFTKVGDDNVRIMLAVRQLDARSELGVKKETKIEGNGVENIGQLFDNQNGWNFQLLEFKKGTNPTISVTQGKLNSGPIPLRRPKDSPKLPWILFGLSIIVIGYLVQKTLRSRK